MCVRYASPWNIATYYGDLDYGLCPSAQVVEVCVAVLEIPDSSLAVGVATCSLWKVSRRHLQLVCVRYLHWTSQSSINIATQQSRKVALPHHPCLHNGELRTRDLGLLYTHTSFGANRRLNLPCTSLPLSKCLCGPWGHALNVPRRVLKWESIKAHKGIRQRGAHTQGVLPSLTRHALALYK